MNAPDAGPKPKSGFWPLALLGGLLVLLATAFSFRFVSYRVGEPVVCASCHEMKPYVSTWSLTSHNTVRCERCHPDVSLAQYSLETVTGRYRRPIQVNTQVSDQVCLGCHVVDRPVTPPEGLLMPHRLHIQKGIDCVRCHFNLTHGEVAVRNHSTPDVDQLAALASAGNRVPMSRCADCHNGTKAPNACPACHRGKQLPASHTSPRWTDAHGQTAFQEAQSCNECHEYDVAKQKQQSNLTGILGARALARSINFCRDCHSRRPASHGTTYLLGHRQAAMGIEPRCETCHNRQNDDSGPPPTTQVVCGRCHYALHPKDWRTQHRREVSRTGSATCFGCHTAESCGTCHTQRQVRTK